MILKRAAVGIALLMVFAGSCFGLWKSMKLDGPKVDSLRPVVKPLESINTCDTCTVQEFDVEGALTFWKKSTLIQVFGVAGKPIPFIDG